MKYASVYLRVNDDSPIVRFYNSTLLYILKIIFIRHIITTYYICHDELSIFYFICRLNDCDMYHLVQFEDGAVEIISDTWVEIKINDAIMKVAFPPKRQYNTLRKILRDNSAPHSTWTTHTVTLLLSKGKTIINEIITNCFSVHIFIQCIYCTSVFIISSRYQLYPGSLFLLI